MAATPANLHDIATQAQTLVHELATGLAHAGAEPQAVQQLTKFAELLGEIANAVHQNPGVEQAAQEGPPQPGQAPGEPPQPGAPQAPPASAHPFHAAATATHQMMQQSAGQR